MTLFCQQTVMLKRWMTEILLEVTTELMEEVSEDVIARAKAKGGIKYLIPCLLYASPLTWVRVSWATPVGDGSHVFLWVATK